MIKIFVLQKPLFLITGPNKEADLYMNRGDTVFIDGLQALSVKKLLGQMTMPTTNAAVILHPNEEELLNAFKSNLTLVVAAGGLVYTPDNFFLLIFRKGKWDLPKGKLEAGESLEICAKREIEEETGAGELTIEKPLHVSYHTYFEKELHILKESHWFLLKAKTKTLLHPQTEEDIERCEWVATGDLATYRSNMHDSVTEVINKGLASLNEIQS